MKKVAFFGHRKIFNQTTVQERIVEILNEITQKGFCNILIGCHGDFDNLALSTCLSYKKDTGRDIKISVVLTSLSFLNKDKYGYSMAESIKNRNCETLFYDIEDVHFKNRITVSNKKMIDDSDMIICYVDMTSYKSGAKNAIKYAMKKNKTVVNLYRENDAIASK